jgi:predicted AlkP superfamily pyrophosphatase or phosphodiesterase
MAEGAYTLKARSVMPSVTLPCHTSMLRGVTVERHGITSNEFHPLARPVPSVIDVAHAAGKRTGFFFNWGQLRDLCDPESLDVSYLFRDAYTPEGDWKLARAAAEHLLQQDFDFLFLYLGHTDECGHEHGWMSQEYLGAIANADRCVGHLLEACLQTGRPRNLLLLSDHGGHGRSHGTECDEDMNIPWIMHGPAFKPGVIESTLYLYDACPTLAHLLGVSQAREWDGRVALEAILD